MNKDTIDVLMATYNGEKYLNEQIQSILNQSHQDFRLIICDDHSKDGTRNICQEFASKYPDKIFIICSEKNLGAKENFSFLMEHAKANYIMFSDQDDIWMNDKIAKTFNEMKRLEMIHGKNIPLLVHSDLKVVDKNCAVLGDSFWKYSNLKAHQYHDTGRFLIQNVVTGCTIMMNRKLNLLSFPIPKESLMHDWWIGLVASTFGKIGLVDESLIYYRQHGRNTLGAQQFGTFQFYKNAFKKILGKDEMLKRIAQAEVFLERYKDQFNDAQKKLVEDYIRLIHFSWAKKRTHAIRHGFYRSGFLRNFFNFFVMFKP